MKIRESGMPEEAYWESLFNVELILDRLGIDATLRDVVELGCGYGTFTLPAARRISGVIETYDIELSMVERTRRRAADAGLQNVRASLRDVLVEGFGGEPGGWDACLLFNILHLEEPIRLLRLAARAIRPSGRILAIHWRHDPSTPRGPALEIRPRPEDCRQWIKQADFTIEKDVIDLPPYHYGLIGRKS